MKIERHDIIDGFGQPDENPRRPMKRNAWRCDACGEVLRASLPVKAPAPCKRCGNICFVVVRDGE